MDLLSPQQRYAFEKFQSGGNLFISGPGGSGKSFLIKYFAIHLQDIGHSFQITSTTGCSAILLSNNIKINGAESPVVKTIHSWSGIRIGRGTKDEIVNSVLKNKWQVREWKRVKTLIIDEISMLSGKLFQVLDNIGRIVRKNNRPFGGIQIVCLGDMYQLPPVGDDNDPETSEFAFESPAWKTTFPIDNHIELTTIYRQKDASYQKILNEIRIGEMSEESKLILESRVNCEYNPDENGGIIPMKIFPTRNQVNKVNNCEYSKIKEEEHIYEVTEIKNARMYLDTGVLFSAEVLDKCKYMTELQIDYELRSLKNGMPSDDEIRLKKGVPVMCLVNLDIENGIANGSIGIIEGFICNLEGKKVPLVKFSNGIQKQIGCHIWQSAEFPCICISQMPLCLAYSNSIHKMQGATLDLCEMNLGSTVFAEHQTYVALSRVKTIEGLFLTDFNPLRIKVNPKVREFYKIFLPIPPSIADTEYNTKTDTTGDVPLNLSQYEYKTPSENECNNECPICIGPIVKPHITACLHRFCHDCIMNYFNNTADTTCPICRTSIKLKEIIPVITNENKVIKVPKPSLRKVVRKGGVNLNLYLEFQKSN
jgi:ATP-dependent DNA helicase PIF1